jgi:hypothetical protein
MDKPVRPIFLAALFVVALLPLLGGALTAPLAGTSASAPISTSTDVHEASTNAGSGTSTFPGPVSGMAPLTGPSTPTPTSTRTSTPTATCTPNPSFFCPGTTRIDGSGCDDCVTDIVLPFNVLFCGTTQILGHISSNGVIGFTAANSNPNNTCVASPSHNNAILAHWDDLLTNCATCGIFTSLSGQVPNRTFCIEWRALYANNADQRVNVEVTLYEGQDRFEINFAQVDQGGIGATVGLQQGTGAPTLYSCNLAGSLVPGLRVPFLNCVVQPAQGICSAPPTPTIALTYTPTRTSTPTVTATPSLTCTPAPSGMVAWYTLDEQSHDIAHDLAGTVANNGLWVGGPTPLFPQWVHGSLNFDGANDFINVPDNSELDFGTGDFTIDAWVRTTATHNDFEVLVDKREFGPSPNSTKGYSLAYTNSGSNGRLFLQMADGNSFTNFAWPVGGPNIADGQWNFVAARVNRSTNGGFLYVNGNTWQFTPETGNLDNSGNLWLARHHPNTNNDIERYYPGALDEVELFDRALDQTELDAIFQAGSRGKCRIPPPPPISCCPMDVVFVVDRAYGMGKLFNASSTDPLAALKPSLLALIPDIALISDNDFRLALVTFGALPGDVTVEDNWTLVGSIGNVATNINSLDPPVPPPLVLLSPVHVGEEALNIVVDEIPLSGFGPWRHNVRRVIVFVTDAPPLSPGIATLTAHLAYLRDIHIAGIVTRALGIGLLAIPPTFGYSLETDAPFLMVKANGDPLFSGTVYSKLSEFIFACADNPPVLRSSAFEDVSLDDNPYALSINCLSARDIIRGYPCGEPGEPCVPPGNRPYFRPQNNVTRGQITKIVAGAAGYTDPIPPNQQTFTDVPPGHTFYEYVERIAMHGIINGYPCGGPGEPCDPQNRNYFRPGNNVTRGQAAKIVAQAAGLNGQPVDQAYTDVPPGHTFYRWIEQLAELDIPNDYACGGPGEPCDAEQRTYFRPGNAATRGEIALFVSFSFFPECSAKP